MNGAGRLIEELLVPIAIALAPMHLPRRRREVRAFADRLVVELQPAAISIFQEHVERRENVIFAEVGASIARAAARDELVAKISMDGAEPVQVGLFDARALKHYEDARHRGRSIAEEMHSRARHRQTGLIAALAQEPELASVLITTC